MINIEVEVKVNGEPVKVSGKLNDLVAWFITQKLVSDDGAVANFSQPAKGNKAPRYTVPHLKKTWSDEDEQLLMRTYTEKISQGLPVINISKEVGDKLGRSSSSVYVKITKLRQAGRL